MELKPIMPESRPEDMGFPEDSVVGSTLKMQVEYYAKIGFHPPWIGYLALVDGVPVGMGGFKGRPVENKVEIAYFTFPENEGKGLGTRTCGALVGKALASDPRVEITARTLPEKNASTRILARNGFVFAGPVQDPEDGEVWEWTYTPAMRKDTILQLESDLIGAIKSSHIPTLERLMHDDLRFLIPDGRMITKAMDLDSHRRGDMVVEALTPHVEDVQILGDTATVVVVYETKGTMLGRPIAGRFRYIRIWKAFDGGAKIIGGACFMLNDGAGQGK